MKKIIPFTLMALPFLMPFSLRAQMLELKVDSQRELKRLLTDQDIDHDKKITVNDLAGRPKNKTDIFFVKAEGRKLEVQGIYFLSNLLQELKLSSEATGDKKDILKAEYIFENPVHRVSRSIRERYWDSLTRKIDVENMSRVLYDDKFIQRPVHYLYVPYGDQEAFDLYSKAAREQKDLKMEVVRLPENVTEDYIDSLNSKAGLLTLGLQKNKEGKLEGIPYVVPGGRFNEMYGWDSYFETLGLLVDGRMDLAKAMVDNFNYQIKHYGKVLNANRSYYLGRSQPPFFTQMVREVYAKMPRNKESKAWLTDNLRSAIKEYETYWMGKDHLTSIGLNRYFGLGKKIPPEVEQGHYDHIFYEYAKKHHLTVPQMLAKYNSGKLQEPELDEFYIHDRAVREAGHDTTYRWRVDGRDRCANFVTVDLNSLLYKVELDLAHLIEEEFGGKFEGFSAKSYGEKARTRKELMRKYLWDADKHLFLDFDFVRSVRSEYLAGVTFFPLWAHDPSKPDTKILSDQEAKLLVEAGLKELEVAGGIASTSLASLKRFGSKHERQWEYPTGWVPHQVLAWQGLRNYGMDQIANRLTYKWLYMITSNAANFNGTVPEKWDVVHRSHEVFAEYGNVGTKFSYITHEGFGWMNGSYQVGLATLTPELKSTLEKLVPAEWVKF